MTPAGNDMKVLVLIGAGSAVFTRGLLADLISSPDLGAWQVRLVDTDERALSIATRLAQRMVSERGRSDIAIDASTERASVLEGAHFVVSCIGVGGRSAWEADWEIAKKHGVLQPVGDSVLPGGISRAMRTVPVMVELANDIARLAPGAMFFNYSNPMTANCAAITRFTDVAVVGLCHGVFHIQHELAHLVRKPYDETSSLFCGINHLTFIYDFRWRGQDAWPLVRQRLAEDRAEGLSAKRVGSLVNDGSHAGYNPFSWELFDRLGAVTGHDRHTTEFFPELFASGSYYGKTLGIDAFSLSEIIARGEETYRLMEQEALGSAPLDSSIFGRSQGEQEQLIPVLRSVLADSRHIVSANLPNVGLVHNLPADAIVEVPGICTARGVRGMSVPDFPDLLAGIIERRLAAVTTTVEAALNGDRSLFAEALLLDGGVSSRLQADALVADFITAQNAYLPRFN